MRFVKPNLPTASVRVAVVDRNAPEGLFSFLMQNKIEYIKSCRVTNCIEAVSTHPDMQICNVGGGNFICEPSTYEYYKKCLGIYGVNISSGEKRAGSNYPYDVAYNVVTAGNLLMHNLAYTEPKILEAARNDGFSICNVRQGYTKCAVCVVSENAFITSDKGVYDACLKNGIDCLFTPVGEIALGKRSDGFFGGCCGLIAPDKLLICGNIGDSEALARIKNFLGRYNVDIVSAFDGCLTDIGSIIPVLQE